MESLSTKSSDNILPSKILPRKFFLQDTSKVAQALLGKGIYIQSAKGVFLSEIIETEAYLSMDDPASHSYRGLTKRNWPMFEAGGISYVYFIYGMHYCFNVVTGKKGVGEAVLIRAVKNIKGPGRLTSALGINLQHNGISLQSKELCLVDLGIEYSRSQILATPRIGISKGKEMLLRYVL